MAADLFAGFVAAALPTQHGIGAVAPFDPGLLMQATGLFAARP